MLNARSDRFLLVLLVGLLVLGVVLEFGGFSEGDNHSVVTGFGVLQGGEACVRNDMCVAGLVCRKSFVQGDKTKWSGTKYFCKTAMTLGGVCERPDQCAVGNTCTANRCTAGGGAPPAERKARDVECPSRTNAECVDGSVCRKLFVTGDKTKWSGTKYFCKTAMTLGGICERQDQCAAGLVCQNNQCAQSPPQPPPQQQDGAQKQSGEACVRNDMCVAGLVCRKSFVQGDKTKWSGTKYFCKTAMTLGGVCERQDQCAAGLVCQRGQCTQAQQQASVDCGYPLLDQKLQELGVSIGYSSRMEAGYGNKTNILISAPHAGDIGSPDPGTGFLASELSKQLNTNYLLAYSYRYLDKGAERVRANVNRAIDDHTGIVTPISQEVYTVYEACRKMYDAETYVELHSNGREENKLRIEIATVNVNREKALQVKESFNQHKTDLLGEYEIAIQPVDRVYWTASGTKNQGTLTSCLGTCWHIEFPNTIPLEKTIPVFSEVILEMAKK